MRCVGLDWHYKRLLEEKAEHGMTPRYFEIVQGIKDHLRSGHAGGKPCPDPENHMT
jgi:hypothetical protein